MTNKKPFSFEDLLAQPMTGTVANPVKIPTGEELIQRIEQARREIEKHTAPDPFTLQPYQQQMLAAMNKPGLLQFPQYLAPLPDPRLDAGRAFRAEQRAGALDVARQALQREKRLNAVGRARAKLIKEEGIISRFELLATYERGLLHLLAARAKGFLPIYEYDLPTRPDAWL